MPEQPITADRVLTVALLILTLAGMLACAILVGPFVPALTWAMALAVLAVPLHKWMLARQQKPGLAAGMATAIVTLAVLAPAIGVTYEIGRQAAGGFDRVQALVEQEGGLQAALKDQPQLAPIVRWTESHIDWKREVDGLQNVVRGKVQAWVGGVVWTVTNALVCMFLLFYFLRDRKQVLHLLRFLLPVAPGEANEILHQVEGMVRSTLYGTLLVAAIQGFMGGLIFWILGIPGALLWGVVMGVLSVIPVLGAFVVWAPVALALAFQGMWMKAVILLVWGALAIGLIDNLLYPILVGKQTRMHTVPMFLALVGGLAVLGAAGLVLGPVLLALTWSLLQALRKRSQYNDGAVDEPA